LHGRREHGSKLHNDRAMRVPDPEGLGRYGRKTMAFFSEPRKVRIYFDRDLKFLDDLKYSCCRDVRGLVLGAKRCMGKLWYTLGIVLIFLFIKLGHSRSYQIPHLPITCGFSPLQRTSTISSTLTEYPEEPVQILRSPKPSSS
jgi:hypothetical protein